MSHLPRRSRLAKAVSYKDYVGLGLGTIVGIAWVIIAGEWLLKAGPLGSILAFLIGGVLLTFIGLCYAELTPAIPVAGGEIAFSYKAFGTGVSFLTGWLLSFGYIALGPFETVAMGWLFEYIFPGAKTKPLYTIGSQVVSLSSILPGLIIGILIIVLNYRGVKITARFQMLVTAAMFVCVFIFLAIAFTKGRSDHLFPLFVRGDSVWSIPASIVAVLGMVPWLLAGFDIIPQAAEEKGKNVAVGDLGKAIVVSIIIGALFYALVTLAMSLPLPWQETVQYELPTAKVLQVAFGYTWAANIVLIAAFLGLVTSMNGKFLACCRVFFAAGRGGLMPKWFEQVHAKFRTPKNAIYVVGLAALAGPFVGKAILLPIIRVAAFGYTCAWFISCLAAIRLRKTFPHMKRPYKIRSVAVLYLGVIISGALIILMITPGSSAQLAWPLEYVIFAVWMILGYVGYHWRISAKDMSQAERDYQILGDYR